MSEIKTFTALDTYKGVKKRSNDLGNIFVDLKFNKKVAKYNYHSGLCAGLLIEKLVMLRPFLESKDNKNMDIINQMLPLIIKLGKSLVEDYNWKMIDLNGLTMQFFGEDND